ncbi:MAG: peptidylprolyl isomerase [Candidatus Alcyoniella australis]|nr:peptidylprolyl isomerase [Candidatus Alcyoniella australis]
MHSIKSIVVIAAVALLAAMAGCEQPQPVVEHSGAVLVNYSGGAVYESDMQRTLDTLPDQVRRGLESNPERQGELLEMLVMRDMAAKEAEANGWLSDPELAQMIEDGRRQVLYNYWIKKEIELDEVTPEMLEAFYQENIDKFRVGEQREVQVIGTADEASINKAFQRLNNGDEFGTVAREMSNSPTAQEGGSMGSVEKGDLVKELDEVVFSTDAGQISKPAKTQFGWYIIKVVATTPPSERPLEQVKDQIEPHAKSWAEQKRYMERTEQLKTKYAVEVVTAEPAAEPATEPVEASDAQ